MCIILLLFAQFVKKNTSHYSNVTVSDMAPQTTGASIVAQAYIKETSKLRDTGRCDGNPPVTEGFPSQKANNTENVPLDDLIIVRRAGLLWSQRDFEWRWSVPLFKCLTVLEFSFILFDLCLLITFFNFIMNYVPIVTFWIFTYHKIWILSIMFCSIWSYWIIYFLACLEVSWRVVS